VLPSLNFPQLDFVKPSSGFHPMTWERVKESNWQFDSRPLKVGNRPDPGVCKWSVTHRWKALEESYNFALDFIPIGGLSKEL